VETPKVLSDYKIACNSHDVNKIVSFFSDDCVLEDATRGIVKHGKKEVTDSFNSMFSEFPDLKYELMTVYGVGDWGCIEYMMSGTQVSKPFSFRAASIFQLSKGKIVHESSYWNVMTYLQQVGLMPRQSK
jgi:steroid delta-isomerase-like uncharacterized protein